VVDYKEIILEIKNHLRKAGILHRPGRVFYSSYHTIREGPFYILGFNPGGSSEHENNTIEKDLEDRNKHNPTYNAYLDETWYRRNSKTGKPELIERGQDFLQKGIQCLFREIFKYDLRKVCASNLIFVRTQREVDIKDWKNLVCKHYWPIHEKILSIVKPKIIVSFGRKPFDYLKQKFNYKKEYDPITAGWANWKIRAIYCEHEESGANKLIKDRLLIFGFPHFSRYRIESDKLKEHRAQIFKWVKDLCNKCRIKY